MRTMILLLAMLAFGASAALAVPATMNYQGQLFLNGSPTTGPVSITFRMFAGPTGGTALWSETDLVSVTGGLFSTTLGDGTAFPATLFSAQVPWLEMEVGGVALTPRTEFKSVSYAFRSDVAALAEGLSSGGPLVVSTVDSRGGCPPAAAANTDLIAQTLNLAASAPVFVTARMNRSASGRADLVLYVDGVALASTITYTPTSQWVGANITWSGTLAAGFHTISVRSPNANVWGCGAMYGAIDTIVFR